MGFNGTYGTNGNAITVGSMILYNTSAQKSYLITNIPVYTKQLCPYVLDP